MAGLRDAVPTLETILVTGGEAPPGTVSFDDVAGAAPVAIPDPPSAADPAVLAFTSGTSASPKAALHPYRTMAASHRILARDCGIEAGDVVLSAPPFSHIYGLCVANVTLYAGAANSLLPAYSPEGFAEAVGRTRPTVLFCGPAHMLACIKAGLLEPGITGGVRRVVLAGSACPPELVDATEAACPGAKAYQMWGMTEVLMQFINPRDASPEVRRSSIGTAPEGHEIRAVADDGRVVGPGEEGELQIRGPFVFAGYYDNAGANRDAFAPDGWFRTGDLATIDGAGNVAMTGRVKDIINRGGIKLNPVDVEGLMDEHPAVIQSAVAPMPDEILGERACLFVVLRPGAGLDLEEVRRYLAEKNVAKLKWPERVVVVDEMPMTPTRKVVKGKLVERL